MIGCVASKRTRSSSSIKIVRFGTSPFSSQCVLTNMGAWFPTSDKSKLGLRMSQLPNLKRYPSHCSCVTLEHFTKFCIMNTGSPASQRKLDHVETPQPNFVFTFLTSPNVVREYPRRSATKIYKNGYIFETRTMSSAFDNICGYIISKCTYWTRSSCHLPIFGEVVLVLVERPHP